MFGESWFIDGKSVAEGGRVVVVHGEVVVGSVVFDEPDFFDGEPGLVELEEDLFNFMGNGGVDDELADVVLVVKSDVGDLEESEVGRSNLRVGIDEVDVVENLLDELGS